jgi:hypothetical protein
MAIKQVIKGLTTGSVSSTTITDTTDFNKNNYN